MSQTLEQLARQQNTLNTISTIVRTMKTLSAINAVPYEQAATAMEGYQAVVEQALPALFLPAMICSCYRVVPNKSC